MNPREMKPLGISLAHQHLLLSVPLLRTSAPAGQARWGPSSHARRRQDDLSLRELQFSMYALGDVLEQIEVGNPFRMQRDRLA